MELIARLFDPANYAHNLYAWPQLVFSLITFLMGAVIYLRERGSRVGFLYWMQTLAIGTWLLGFAMGRFAIDPVIADSWIKVGHTAALLFPAVILHFTWGIVQPAKNMNWILWGAWLGSIALISFVPVPGYLGEPYKYEWGYYVHYTFYSAPFIPLVSTVIVISITLLWQEFRQAPPNSIAARRAKLLCIAFAFGGSAGGDFLPAFGIDWFPSGYIPVVIGIGLVSYVTGRYRLVDITPAFAAKQIIETMHDGLFLLDKEAIVRVANDPLLEMLGLKREDVIGKRVPEHMRRLVSSDEIVSLQAGHPIHNREVEFVRGDGTQLVLSLGISVMRERGKHTAAYIGVVRDVTEQRRNEQRIRSLAYYDSLTGLPNRQMFQEGLATALTNAANNHRMIALLFLDIDHFKRINDTLGHAVGDELLQAVAGRLQNCVRRTRKGSQECEDTVARLGGDEFIVVLYDLSDRDDAMRVAERILAAISMPLRLQHHDIAVTASLGISIYPHDGEDAGTLLKNADAAMYQAKEAGRNSCFFYDRTTNAALYDRLSLENKLRKALEQKSLMLHYQPLVSLGTNEAIGVEALLRWYDPELGWVPPTRFIPIAEESGLILPIGEWVLRTACAQARAWEQARLPPIRVAVNLSSRQFLDRDFVSVVRNALESTDLQAKYLELELTESMVMQDAIHTIRTLEALKTMGVHLSIDDFGTGYSSLSYLRSFPVDTLKIDRSFVHEINAEPDSGPIVAAIIAMAHSLGLGVVGEGVETKEQQTFLQMHGCRVAQGFMFCKPLPADELAAWMRKPVKRTAG